MSTPHILLPLLIFILASPDYPGSVVAAADALPPVSFSYNFSDASTYRLEELHFLDDAKEPVDGVVDLTICSSRCQGRMSYNHSVPMYRRNGTSIEFASFATRFTFAIKPIDGGCQGDGMAFFLANYPSAMPGDSDGGDLGLIDGATMTAVGPNRFVAVEFDTFNRSYDPPGNHIGIDLSSVKNSVRTTVLPLNLNGSMTAFITFNSSTRMLVASLWLHDGHPSSAANPYQVSAQLPDLDTLLPAPEVAVGFSASTGECKELHQILSWSFNSTLAPTKRDKYKKAGLVGGLTTGGVLVLALMVWFLFSCRKQKRSRNTFERGTGGARQFKYRDLADATNNFSEKLGEGAFGAVYKGDLKQLDCEVAVKKITRESSEGHKDFFSEVSTISQAKHKNLVKFYGWCSRGHSWNILRFMCSCFRKEKNKELFLVYELMKKGNLNDYLYKSEAPEVLSWQIRHKIAKDIGSGLLYLHHECNPYILHRDIKPGNVLLDDDFTAKLADFGLSRMANPGNATLQTTAIGSNGYMDPQCMRDGSDVRFNRSSDIYSFGIALLDISCARRHRDQIWELYRSGGDVVDAADTRLTIGGGLDRRDMKRVIILGLWCSSYEAKHRPTMRQAMDVLERDAPLPDLNNLIVVNSTLASSDQLDNASSSLPDNGYHCEEAPLFAGNSSSQLNRRASF
uniref:non-specific serine/threonine protein kinase n=1 Tax=Leersia perrieri TaxID=77586 RepID=A0A0D9W203_9ORYZ